MRLWPLESALAAPAARRAGPAAARVTTLPAANAPACLLLPDPDGRGLQLVDPGDR